VRSDPVRRGIVWRNVYIHIPFCAAKCGYCAFYSLPGAGSALRAAFLDKLAHDLERTEFSAPAETLYLGGGTPNYLSSRELDRLIGILRSAVPLAPDAEVSCELNPELLTPEKWDILSAFITRASLGVQSFSALLRDKLWRRCRDRALEQALDLLHTRPPRHWNCDLIYGIAGSAPAEWRRDLELASQCGADHLSCYALTPEENSRLGLADAPVQSDEDQAEQWLATGAILARRGFLRYEISNYAQAGAECRHNRNVWQGQTLLAFGPAASGFDGRDRWTETPDLARWLSGAPPEIDRIAPEHREAEIFAVNLRTAQGWTPELWGDARRIRWEDWRRRAERLREANPAWWIVTPERIALTEAGLLFWDSVAEALLP